jgi:hypothetical protein
MSRAAVVIGRSLEKDELDKPALAAGRADGLKRLEFAVSLANVVMENSH